MLFFFGSAVAYLIASGLFRLSKRKFALSVVMVQAITLISSVMILFLLLLVPRQMLETQEFIYAASFMSGLLDTSMVLFIHLLGPLLVAANSRRTYEVTMGGTMIAVCNGLPYVFGSVVGAVLVMVSNVIG